MARSILERGDKTMIPFPEVVIQEKTAEYKLVETFLTTPYFDEANEDLIADDIDAEFPYAPPGMYQKMIPKEFEGHRFWLRHVLKNWEADTDNLVIIPTVDRNVFWAIREERADSYIGKRYGRFINEAFFRITVNNGKIAAFREYDDPHAFYNAMGIILPAFHYAGDLPANPECARFGKNEISKHDFEYNRKMAIKNFMDPIAFYSECDEIIYADNVTQVIPFAAYDHATFCTGTDFDRMIDWVMRTTQEWNAVTPSPFYESPDPKCMIVEGYGYGSVSWSFIKGRYTQREVQFAHLDDAGKLDHFRVYFNPLYEYASMNQSIPTIPYMNF